VKRRPHLLTPDPQPISELLLAGCRRLLAAPGLDVRVLQCQPLPGGLSGSVLERCSLQVHDGAIDRTLILIHKRGAVVAGAFLRGASQREAWVYHSLRPHIPLTLPDIVAVDVDQGDIWMVPFAASKPGNHWSAAWDRDDVEQSLQDLARLHHHFWGQTAALAQHSWLARPIGRDAEALLADARAGLSALQAASAYDAVLTPAIVQQWLALAYQPQPLLDELRAAPATLLHGDAGFQNIAITKKRHRRIWYDWQLAAIGPAVLDVVTFLHPWAYPQARPPLSLPEMAELYQQAIRQTGISLEQTAWMRQLDAALLWRWLSQWAPLLGLYRQRLRNDVRERLYQVFTKVHWPALQRWSRART